MVATTDAVNFGQILLNAAVLLAIAAAIWGILIERNLYAIRRESLRVLPKGAQPIAILHISDVHMAPWQRRKQRWIKQLEQQNFDLVVNTGDNLGHSRAIEPVLACYGSLLGQPGVFVHGSNDYYAPALRNPLSYLRAPSKRGETAALETDRLTKGFEASGWRNLNNAGASIEVNGTRIGFIGVDDPHDGLDDLESLKSSASQLGQVDLLVGVAHAPYLKVIDAMADAGARLMFAGHTHGGQVGIPGFGAIITNCDLPRKYAKGLSAWAGGRLALQVCAGLGHSIYAPVRFAVRPEVRILTLLPEL